MSYSVEQLPGEPIIIATMHDDFSMDEYGRYVEDVTALVDSLMEPMYVITVVNKNGFSFQELLEGTNISMRGSNLSLHNHPLVAGMIVVTDNKLLKLALKGMNSETFGNIQIDTYAGVSGL